MDFLGLIDDGINWSVPTWDLFIIFIFVIASFLYGLSLGRSRLIVILVSVYISLALAHYFPYANYNLAELEVGRLFALKITAFLGLVLITFFFLSRSALSSVFKPSRDYDGTWFQILVFSFLHVGLLVSVILSFLPENSLAYFAPATRRVFSTESARFIWMLMPLIFMALLRKRRRRVAAK